MSDETESSMEPSGLSKYRDKIVNGSIIRTIFWLGIPPLLNQLVIVAYNITDTYWLSAYDELTVAVPRQMFPVIVLFQAFIMALTAACLSIVSQYVGAKDYRKASLEASRFFTLAFFSGAILSTLLLVLRSVIFTWMMATPSEIFDYVMIYAGIIALDILFNYIALTYTTLLQSLGDTKRPAIVNVVSVGINMILDPILVLGIGPFPKLGVVGAALTDVMGKVISALGQAYILRKNYSNLKIGLTKNMDAKWSKLVLRISLPILVLSLMNGFAFTLQLRFVNMLGIVVAAAFSIGFVIIDTVDAALWGLSGAPAIMIGQNLGASKQERAREIALKGTVLIFAIVAVLSCIVYPFRQNLADIFANDLNIVNETTLFLETLVPTLPFFGIFINAVSVGRGSGHTVFSTTLGIVRILGIRLALGYFLAFVFQMRSIGIWLALAISNVISGTIAILWIKYGRWNQAIVNDTGEK